MAFMMLVAMSLLFSACGGSTPGRDAGEDSGIHDADGTIQPGDDAGANGDDAGGDDAGSDPGPGDPDGDEPVEEPDGGDQVFDAGDPEADAFDAGTDAGDLAEDATDEDSPEVINCGQSTSDQGPWPDLPTEGPCQGYVPGSDPPGSFCDCLAIPGCDRPYVVAHAGGTFLPHQANRIATYDENCPKGMDFVETDVQITADGDCVYLHDETFWGRNVSEMTVAEIKQIDSTVITLRESYAWAQNHRVFFMQDFKGSDAVIPLAVQQTAEAGMLDRVVFFGNAGEMSLVEQANPQAWKMLRVGSAAEARAAADDPDPYLIAIHGDDDYTDQALVRYLHDRGKRYLVDIIKSGPICGDLFGKGVDLVETNFVDVCAQEIDSYQSP
jgi:hypothetical protein